MIAIAISGTVGTITSTATLARSNEETTRAYQAAREAVEQLMSANASVLFALYNDTPLDDPPPPGGLPAKNFDVFGLDPVEGDPDGLVGSVLVPVDAGNPLQLRENRRDESFGLPRDLNADGVMDNNDHSGDYVLLPMRVRLDWQGISGERHLELDLLVGAR